ncbi:hypothetical protein J9317_06305 [Metabacillus sp. KIGAM252]|uniref:Uncharacterized protein n=1 Tax=Metabacillus flavus TaxID=2823519 RepID=A0ABS5LCN4_9BACI|nr:hypothetical protein [Metabacillus flavus]MBS2968369.1 hypothetical protein [Metabacillus flavus]
MKKAAVLGAHTFLGFALCMEWLEKGVEVLAVYEKAKNSLEERRMEEMWMTVGRNALFELVCKEENPDLQSCDAAVCETEWLEHHNTIDIPLLIIEKGGKARKEVSDHNGVIYAGKMYGPWQPATEELTNWRAEDFAVPPFKKDPGLYIEDAAKTIAELAAKDFKGQSFYLPGNGVRREELYPLVQETPIKKGLEELKKHMEQYPFLYDSSALV